MFNTNNYFKTAWICNSIVRVTAFVCITVAAIKFNSIPVLFFYLIPAFMGLSTESSKSQKKD